MTFAEWASPRSIRWALGGLGAALALDAYATIRAVRIDAVTPVVSLAVDTAAALARQPARAPSNIDAGVAKDPFSAFRAPPMKRYVMPSDVEAAPVVEAAKPMVLGTAISVDGRSFAICQLGTDRPRTVHVGDVIGEHTVKSIAKGSVVFTRLGREFTVPALRPGM